MAQIAAGGGYLSFEKFMEFALHAPGLGYYSGGARKLGPDGTNSNELTHQGLTDLGRGATFYDCLVEVAAVQ